VHGDRIGAIAEPTAEAIGIAYRDDGDACGARRQAAAAIADTFARGELSQLQDDGREAGYRGDTRKARGADAVEAEAEAIAARGRAEAEAVQAAGEAEAKAMSDKADALDKYGEAATQQMVLDKAPDIARALAEPMGSVKDMSIISTDGASALPKAVAGNVEQLNAVMRSLTGSDLTDMLGRFIDDKGDKKPGV